jgi:hypothetical protein
MTAVKLGQTRYTVDAAFDRTITGERGTVTVTDAGPPFFSGMFLVRGMGRKAYVEGLGDALSLARTLVGLDTPS